MITLLRSANSPTPRSLALIGVWLLSLISVIELGLAQEVVSADPSESTTIASREEELRRKEEELLRSMANQAQSSEAATTISIPAIKVAPTAAPAQELEAPASERVSTSADNDPLKELGNHPALEPQEQVRPQSYPTQSNQIRTYSDENSPDGTTANRLGKFTRVERDQSKSKRAYQSGRAPVIVPIQPISREPYARPAAFSFQEQATVKVNSASLKTGPTSLDSTVMQLPRDTELTIDYRTGSWYRVRTRQGLRGWIASSALLFNATVPGYSTVRIGGVRGTPR